MYKYSTHLRCFWLVPRTPQIFSSLIQVSIRRLIHLIVRCTGFFMLNNIFYSNVHMARIIISNIYSWLFINLYNVDVHSTSYTCLISDVWVATLLKHMYSMTNRSPSRWDALDTHLLRHIPYQLSFVASIYHGIFRIVEQYERAWWWLTSITSSISG